MTETPLERDWARYKAERGRYKRAALAVKAEVERVAASVGIKVLVDGREKTPAEFQKKCYRKADEGYLEDPWGKLTDKAGARAIVALESQVDALATAIVEAGTLPELDDRSDTRRGDPAELRYRGLHIQVQAPSEADDRGVIECELQLRTSAQDLWSSVVSHRFLYKPLLQLPDDVQRSMYRLVALVEMFDGEVGRAMNTIRSLDGFEATELLDLAERHYLSLVAHPEYDRGLSLQILDDIRSAIAPAHWPTYAGELAAFVRERDDDLRFVYAEHANTDSDPGGRYLLFTQPESIILLERLTNARAALVEAWSRAELPDSWLRAAAGRWGVQV